MNRMVFRKIDMRFITFLAILFLACAAQAAVPVSPPESRFVWESGENLTFTWTNENFDGFYYDARSRAVKEFLTIKLDNMKDRYIPKNGITYFKTPGQTNTHYKLSRKYAVLELRNQKYLAEYTEDGSDIKSSDGRITLHQILIDNNTSHKVENGSRLPFSYGHDLEVKNVNLSNVSVLFSLKMDGVDVDTRILGVGENFIYEANDGQIIAVHVDSVTSGGEENSVILNGIFQTSERFTKNMNGNIFGMMVITDVSDTGITMKNTAGIVELKPGQIIDIGLASLKIADSNTLRFCLYSDPGLEKNGHRGAVHTELNDLRAWDGLNYAGFIYDIDSGNYSESLEITNITGRTIPKGGLVYTSYLNQLTYTSYLASVPSAVTNINDKKTSGKNWSYVTFSLGGNRYILKSKISGLLTAHGVTYYDIMAVGIGPFKFNGKTWELDEGYTIDGLGGIPIIWELGEGYTLKATSVNFSEEQRKVRLVFKRNSVELGDVWLKQKDAYRINQIEENETPKLITYIDNIFSGSTIDVFLLRNTWFVSDNITQIKESERLGVFNVTAIEPDRIVLTNMEPIELKTGSSIYLFGNLSFFVENSSELRFYPINNGGMQMVPEEVTVNEVPDIPDVTIPVGTSSVGTFPIAIRTEKALGFEFIISITIILALYMTRRKFR